MVYTKTVWVNDTSPFINDTNLNKIEQGIYDLSVLVNQGVNDTSSPTFAGLTITGTGTFDHIVENNPTLLLLNQTTPQTIVNGIPLLDKLFADFTDIREIVNKNYVDTAVTSLGAAYYMTDNASGEDSYKLCSLSPPTESETYIEAASLGDDDFIAGWISDVDEAPTKLLKGVYNWFIFLEKTTGTATLRVYWKLFERKSDDSEVEVTTSSKSDEIDEKQPYMVPLSLATDYTLDAGSRIVGKLYASVGSSGNAPTVRLYYRGTSGSRWEIPANTEIFQNIFMPYTGALHDVDLGSHSLTTSGITVGTLSGILKASTGAIGTATADTDYQQPISWGDGLQYSSPTASIDYNTTNLKIDAGKLNTIQDINTSASPTFAGLTVVNAITEFSTDTALADDSDAALPTEHAVKTYVDNAVSGASLYAFKTITGITNDVVADAIGDTLTLASANARLTIVGTSATDTITFTVDTDLHNYDWTNVDTTDLKVGTITQAWDAGLDDIAELAVTDGNFIVGNGTNWVAESGNTARSSLGLGTGNSPTFAGLTLNGNLNLGGHETTNFVLEKVTSDPSSPVQGQMWYRTDV